MAVASADGRPPQRLANLSPVEAAALVAAGFAIGAYATAIGAGGGFLIAPLLLVHYADAEPTAVTSASLSVVAVSSGVSTVMGARRRRIDYPVAGALAAAAVPGALIGASLTGFVPQQVFTGGIAVMLLLLAAYLAWKPRAAFVDPVRRGWRRRFRDGEGDVYGYRVPLLRSLGTTLAAALVAALAGIGGGVLYVPLATRVMRMPHPLAVPTAHVVIATLAVVVAGFHFAAGHMDEPMRDVVWLVAGVVLANPIGQRLNRRLGEGALTRALAAGLLIASLRTAWGVA